MKIEWLPSPETPEPLVRLKLTQTELRAMIHRLVPADTWMKQRSTGLIAQTFEDPAQAEVIADDITDRLIRIHDNPRRTV